MIKLQKLSKLYQTKKGEKLVFDEVDFIFPEGKNIAILGRSNSGKTTLLNLINGSIYPTSGEVKTTQTISWPFGVKNILKGDLTAKQNIYVIAKIMGLNEKQAAAKVNEIKEISDVDEYFDNPVKTFSSSMKNNLVVSLSLSFDFDTYLIDDAYSLKELNQNNELQKIFERKVIGSNNIILTTNEIKYAKQYCNYFVVIKDKKLNGFENISDAEELYIK